MGGQPRKSGIQHPRWGSVWEASHSPRGPTLLRDQGRRGQVVLGHRESTANLGKSCIDLQFEPPANTTAPPWVEPRSPRAGVCRGHPGASRCSRGRGQLPASGVREAAAFWAGRRPTVCGETTGPQHLPRAEHRSLGLHGYHGNRSFVHRFPFWLLLPSPSRFSPSSLSCTAAPLPLLFLPRFLIHLPSFFSFIILLFYYVRLC